MKLKSIVLICFSMLCIESSFGVNETVKKLSAKDDFKSKIMQLESEFHGYIGIYVIDTQNKNVLSYNESRRFPFCSTSKFMVASAILKSSESNSEYLNQRIYYKSSDVLKSGYAPITSKNIKNGMTLFELSEAALDYSDNLAMNLMIYTLGGVDAVNKFAKSIGNTTFRLDRLEPELNSATPNDNRDTVTPISMVNSMKNLLLEDYLNLKQREQLTQWLKNNTTGNTKIRAGLPKNWVAGDKTGGGSYGTANDIAILYPPNCSPILLGIYTTQNVKDAKPQDKVIVETTKIAIQELAKTNQCIKDSLQSELR